MQKHIENKSLSTNCHACLFLEIPQIMEPFYRIFLLDDRFHFEKSENPMPARVIATSCQNFGETPLRFSAMTGA
jgi:hypothetical protein